MPVPVPTDDPISLLLSPPPNETSEEAALRLAKEAEARRVSDEIDRKLQVERDALKNQNVLKMLLLGQSESGKSTTLKNIQRIQAPDSWEAERRAWRTVIHLNLVRAVNTILDALQSEVAQVSSFHPNSPPLDPLSDSDDDHDLSFRQPPSSPPPPSRVPSHLLERHSALRLQFAPLRRVEEDLKMALGAGADEITDVASSHGHAMVATPFDATSIYSTSMSSNDSHTRRSRGREPSVRSHDAWKSTVVNGRTSTSPGARRGTGSSPKGENTEVIAMFRSDIKALWKDDGVREVLARQKVILGDSAEYFFKHVDRIASRHYEPTDDDVVRARLRTVGVQEYRIPFIRAAAVDREFIGKEWRIYDVGGSRTMRAAWLPYFEDVQAILFLAPISCFDERLAEDRSVNRVKDSFILWKSIVGSGLLAKSIIILFLNKCDLLDKKLKGGVSVKKYIPRYGDRENSMPVFGRYLREKFRDYMNEYSPERRPFYGYLTSVVDTKATAATLTSIQDGILQGYLEKGMLL
ncbi:guanine nucleotide binding protein, alpha subunit [Irpex rosettiformis]|uniref:Guanine nucleotide binding protein, alpha subunit n=1 Tax=Irpex rosettiformis TaxID=378272 RepID=A0ACB8U1P2_9APHY|nr:guanine nucleotide binding protein, alpha subunit [Irpex rosettiformis]